MEIDPVLVTFTAPEAGWYQLGDGPPRLLTDDEVAALDQQIPPDSIAMTFDSEPIS